MKALATGFILLALGSAGGPVPVAAPAPVEQAGAVPRWEYRVQTKEEVLDLGKKDLAAGLNKLGDEGWELAAIDGAYIFKRPKESNRRPLGEVKALVAHIEADLEVMKDRVAWAKLMAKKGFLTDREVQTEQAGLRRVESALERARRELKTFPVAPNDAAQKERKSEK